MSSSHRTGALAALTLAALVACQAPLAAQDFATGDLVIKRPWARATPKGAQVGAGYLTIVNKGTVPDQLVTGSFAAAAGFEIHDMAMDKGVMRMRPTGPVDIPAGGTLVLSPSGKHVMLTGLKQGLQQGQTIDGSLTFKRAGTVPIRFDVEGIGAKTPSKNQAMPGMDMH